MNRFKVVIVRGPLTDNAQRATRVSYVEATTLQSAVDVIYANNGVADGTWEIISVENVNY